MTTDLSGDQNKLVEQLFCYRVHAQGMREALLPMIILKQLKVPDDVLVQGILPSLDSTDAHTVKEAYEWLWGTDKDRSTKAYNFHRYKAVLEKSRPDIPSGMILYMYDRDPQTAVVTIAEVYGQNVPGAEIAVKSHGDTKESVDFFSGRTEWWAHLYVAVMMERDPSLRTTELVKKLEEDTNPLVHEKVLALKAQLQAK